MARYLLVRVEDNAKAKALHTKLDATGSTPVVAMFAIPIEFCDGKCQKKERGKESLGNQISKLSPKLGWRYCPVCRKAKLTEHSLVNLLHPEGVSPHFSDCSLRVKEPFHNDPKAVYGENTIKAYGAQVLQAWDKIQRSRRRRVRKAA